MAPVRCQENKSLNRNGITTGTRLFPLEMKKKYEQIQREKIFISGRKLEIAASLFSLLVRCAARKEDFLEDHEFISRIYANASKNFKTLSENSLKILLKSLNKIHMNSKFLKKS